MSEQNHPKLEKIIALCRRRPHFSVQAYLFMLDVVSEASRAKSASVKQDSGSRHITGQELLEHCRALLLKRFGPMAHAVLQFWEVSRTEDFGEIIFDLVAQDILAVSPDDTINDFANGFDFSDSLVKPFQALGPCPPLPTLD